MARKNDHSTSLKRIRTVQVFMIFAFSLLVIVTAAIVSQMAVRKTDEVLKNKVISLTSSLNVQMKLNLDSYMARMETIATLAFGEKEAYTYDATDPSNDEYEAINTEKVITDKLYSLCIMENFVDYGIVYRNNRTVGKISNGTTSLFGDALFDELSAMITRDRTSDGWATGYNDDFRRIYYVKRVHDNAVLVISFYSNELDAVFDNPETLSDMDIRLVDRDYDIIFSKNSKEAGKRMPQALIDHIQGQSSASVMDGEYLVSVNRSDDWYVVCSIPTDTILKEKNEMKRFIYLTALGVALAAALVGFYLSYRLTRPVKKMVSVLDDKARADLLTGILNKLTFEEYAQNCLERSLDKEKRALLILDIDDFKSVNDKLGHAAGDRVLKKTGQLLQETFSEDDYLGRIGGDEFCILVNSRAPIGQSFEDMVEQRCAILGERFTETVSEGEMEISASIGVSMFPRDGRSFHDLYLACDKALYRSKGSGKNTYSIYDEALDAQENEGGEQS